MGKYAINDTATEVRHLRNLGVSVLGVFAGEEKDLSTEKKIFGKDFAYIRDISNFSRIVGRDVYKRQDLAYQTDQDLKNILGHVAYLLEGVKRLFDIKSYHMRIESEELTVEDDFIFGMITNSRSVGGFKNLTGKNVDMNDGLFEVTMITRPKNPLELQEIMTAMLTAEDNTDLIHSFKSARVTTVSYTHLDVYKRQALESLNGSPLR